MSKEQTLIEKLYNDFEIDPISFNYTDFEERVNEIVNVNVLEALEKEFKKIDVQYYESGFGNKEQGGKYYYETEVKPKYKL
jgi:hypothetical protein